MGFFSLFGKKKKGAKSDAQDPQASKGKKPAKKKNRATIKQEKLEIDENYVAPVYSKSDEVNAFLTEVMNENFLFSSLTDNQKVTLVEAMQPESFAAGKKVIVEGDVGDYYYIIENGEVVFTVDGEAVGSIGKGKGFGELALLYNSPRAATCTAKTDLNLYKVDQKTFRFIMVSSTQSGDKEMYNLLKNVSLFADLDYDFFVKLTKAMDRRTFKAGTQIIKKGDIGDTFYVIRKGKVKVSDIGDGQYADHELGAGAFFGERALITGDTRAANISTVSDTVLFCLDRQDFNEILGPLSDILQSAERRRVVTSIPIFNSARLKEHERARLIGFVRNQNFSGGTVLSTERGFYLVEKGEATLEDGTVIKDGGYVGDYDKAGQKVTFTKDTLCGVLLAEKIDMAVKNIVERSTKPKTDVRKKVSYGLDDVKKHRVLGQGSFGTVWLVTTPDSDEPLALKRMKKHELYESKQVKNIFSEKEIMYALDHPFIIQLHATFQDKYSIFMLMSLIQGGELYQHMQSSPKGKLSTESARFYGACAVDALAHMHERNILHRDIKPENILIGGDGYAVLIDMGFAKIVSDKTFTLCGTPIYLAPEILLMKGHDKGVDYWACGVLLFEMLVGHEPFYSSDQTVMFKMICKCHYAFPKKSIGKEAEDIIQRILVKRNKRLGTLAAGADDIKTHQFFKKIDFDLLEQKQIKAPWKPKVKSELDAANFPKVYVAKEKNVKVPADVDDLFRGF